MKIIKRPSNQQFYADEYVEKTIKALQENTVGSERFLELCLQDYAFMA